MKKLLYYSLLFFSFLSCNDVKDDDFVTPTVARAAEFINYVKHNDKAAAMGLMYTETTKNPQLSHIYDSLYDIIHWYVHSKKLTPQSDWTTETDEMSFGWGDSKIMYDEVIIPFADDPVEPTDPRYLFVGYQLDESSYITEFGIVRKSQVAKDSTIFFHYLSPVLYEGWKRSKNGSRYREY